MGVNLRQGHQGHGGARAVEPATALEPAEIAVVGRDRLAPGRRRPPGGRPRIVERAPGALGLVPGTTIQQRPVGDLQPTPLGVLVGNQAPAGFGPASGRGHAATLERLPYANMLLTKGVLADDGTVVCPERPIRRPRGLRP